MIEMAIKDFLFLWATIDPVSTVFIFAALTAKMTAQARNTIALKAVIYAGVVLFGSIVIGQLVLSGMGIRMISFQVAGGIVLFLFALQMIFSNLSETDTKGEGNHDIAVFPLAIPAIATPGAIMAAIILTDNKVYSMPEQLLTAGVLLFVLIITYVMMLGADRILRVIGNNGASIIVKVMGMLLVALSIELIFEAIGIERWLTPYP
jgi:multiple antibiotic resistance protein